MMFVHFKDWVSRSIILDDRLEKYLSKKENLDSLSKRFIPNGFISFTLIGLFIILLLLVLLGIKNAFLNLILISSGIISVYLVFSVFAYLSFSFYYWIALKLTQYDIKHHSNVFSSINEKDAIYQKIIDNLNVFSIDELNYVEKGLVLLKSAKNRDVQLQKQIEAKRSEEIALSLREKEDEDKEKQLLEQKLIKEKQEQLRKIESIKEKFQYF